MGWEVDCDLGPGDIAYEKCKMNNLMEKIVEFQQYIADFVMNPELNKDGALSKFNKMKNKDFFKMDFQGHEYTGIQECLTFLEHFKPKKPERVIFRVKKIILDNAHLPADALPDALECQAEVEYELRIITSSNETIGGSSSFFHIKRCSWD
ncbi:MAG: hypothetical protein JXB23_00100 [Candidatus Aminicenantes bacterium]|nr:hypothetical protein [Candidatus Aminicenantes bacterium]